SVWATAPLKNSPIAIRAGTGRVKPLATFMNTPPATKQSAANTDRATADKLMEVGGKDQIESAGAAAAGASLTTVRGTPGSAPRAGDRSRGERAHLVSRSRSCDRTSPMTGSRPSTAQRP